ncbi:Glycine/D-amino acid oxidase [Rhizobiales bacterium GAS113]|nr:Glycine/D-amino acid oxidase [Rhizobiales bacterium GAS113]
MNDKTIFAEDFKSTPYWWEAYQPADNDPTEVPASTHIAIIGAGYAGLSCALELASKGHSVTVLEADVPGIGASTRSGGQVTGGVNVGKAPSGRQTAGWAEREAALLSEASAGYRLFEDILEKHQITCGYHKNGRLTLAWTPAHLRSWAGRVDKLNRLTGAGLRLLTPDELRDEIASDFCFGGLLMTKAGHIHPALYFGGLLRAARAQGALVCSKAPVRDIRHEAGGFRVVTAGGELSAEQVVIASNAYPGAFAPRLRRGIIPVTTHMIATEELPDGLAASLIPRNRAVAETRRVVNHYRLSPDGKRLLFGGRARFTRIDERASGKILRDMMVARFPQLAGTKISHSWGGRVAVTLDYLPHIGTQEGVHYALGCNGSGITMMTYLGHAVACAILERRPTTRSAYGAKPLPTHPLYTGNPWFLPAVGSWYQLRDAMDRRIAVMRSGWTEGRM